MIDLCIDVLFDNIHNKLMPPSTTIKPSYMDIQIALQLCLTKYVGYIDDSVNTIHVLTDDVMIQLNCSSIHLDYITETVYSIITKAFRDVSEQYPESVITVNDP
jgi:hypothetical protein